MSHTYELVEVDENGAEISQRNEYTSYKAAMKAAKNLKWWKLYYIAGHDSDDHYLIHDKLSPIT